MGRLCSGWREAWGDEARWRKGAEKEPGIRRRRCRDRRRKGEGEQQGLEATVNLNLKRWGIYSLHFLILKINIQMFLRLFLFYLHQSCYVSVFLSISNLINHTHRIFIQSLFCGSFDLYFVAFQRTDLFPPVHSILLWIRDRWLKIFNNLIDIFNNWNMCFICRQQKCALWSSRSVPVWKQALREAGRPKKLGGEFCLRGARRKEKRIGQTQ